MPLPQYIQPIQNIGFHNLCTHTQPPPGTKDLLGHSLNYCIQRPLPKPNITATFTRFIYDVRTRFAIADFDNHDSDYNPKLYVKSDTWTPDAAPLLVEDALRCFKEKLLHATLATRQRRQHNLRPQQRKLLLDLRANPKFIIVPTDKNLGPAIMNRDTYKSRALQDHLLDQTSYRRLTPAEAQSTRLQAGTNLKALVNTHRKELPTNDVRYFDRSFSDDRRLPQFYITPKVHKEPWSTRPIVSCVESNIEVMSKYLDYQLQRVVHCCPSRLKDSASLLNDLQQLPPLPLGTKLATADAVSMYTNMDTQHVISTVNRWLHRHKRALPSDLHIELITEAISIVMTQNVFQFDDTYWIQTCGAAMGTSVACVLATIYYSYHEETALLPTYGNGGPLLFYKRFIDDGFIIWKPTVPYAPFDRFKSDLCFGKLTWTAASPSHSVDFLDLTLSISNGSISSKTYTKEHNLHLYLPPSSAHSPGTLKSLIFGNLQRYWKQNTHTSDYVNMASAFRQHLLARGHHSKDVDSIFLAAAHHIDAAPERPSSNERSAPKLFLHWEYHPKDLPRQHIRSLFNETCGPTLSRAKTMKGNTPQLGRLTIAYSKPKSIGNALCQTKMTEPNGQNVSDYIRTLSTATPSP